MSDPTDQFDRPFDIDSPTEQFYRPFKLEPAPELTHFSDPPEWKAADMDYQYGQVYWHTGYDDYRQQMPYPSTDFDSTHVDPDDWW